MKELTETAIRTIAMLDGEIPVEKVEKAIAIMKGVAIGDDELRIMKRLEVAAYLNVHPRTVDYYMKKGLLGRAVGAGKKAIGISRQSVIDFAARRCALKDDSGC